MFDEVYIAFHFNIIHIYWLDLIGLGLNPSCVGYLSIPVHPARVRCTPGLSVGQSNRNLMLNTHPFQRRGWECVGTVLLLSLSAPICNSLGDPYFYRYIFAVHLAWRQIFTQLGVTILSSTRPDCLRGRPKLSKYSLAAVLCQGRAAGKWDCPLTQSITMRSETFATLKFVRDSRLSQRFIIVEIFYDVTPCHWARISRLREAVWCFRNVTNPLHAL